MEGHCCNGGRFQALEGPSKKKNTTKNLVVMDLETSQKSVAYCFAQNWNEQGSFSDSKAGNEQNINCFCWKTLKEGLPFTDFQVTFPSLKFPITRSMGTPMSQSSMGFLRGSSVIGDAASKYCRKSTGYKEASATWVDEGQLKIDG